MKRNQMFPYWFESMNVANLEELHAEKIVNKLLTSSVDITSQRVISPSPDAMKRAVVVQSGLASRDAPRGHQPSKLVTRVQIPATADYFS